MRMPVRLRSKKLIALTGGMALVVVVSATALGGGPSVAGFAALSDLGDIIRGRSPGERLAGALTVKKQRSNVTGASSGMTSEVPSARALAKTRIRQPAEAGSTAPLADTAGPLALATPTGVAAPGASESLAPLIAGLPSGGGGFSTGGGGGGFLGGGGGSGGGSGGGGGGSLPPGSIVSPPAPGEGTTTTPPADTGTAPPGGGVTTPPPADAVTAPPGGGGATTPPPADSVTTPPGGAVTTPPPADAGTTPPGGGGTTPPGGGVTAPPPADTGTAPPAGSEGSSTPPPADTGNTAPGGGGTIAAPGGEAGTPPVSGGGGLLPAPGGLIGVPSVSAIPEAETWMMMIIGFGALGFMLRRRRNGMPRSALQLSVACDRG